tara:strand:- start:853 stop:1047 length:195 start_codon:yes stop_codon:yes gene_type:complete
MGLGNGRIYTRFGNVMEVTVYMEHGSCSTELAKFIDEDTYMACLPALKSFAEKFSSTITESLGE